MKDNLPVTGGSVQNIEKRRRKIKKEDHYAAQQASKAAAREPQPRKDVYKAMDLKSSRDFKCSERDVITSIARRLDTLVSLVKKASSKSIADSRADEGRFNIPRIIQFLDEHLEETGKSYLTPPEANRLLSEEGLLRDNPGSPGESLRELLRNGSIPHALQPSGKGGRWYIPHSRSKEKMVMFN